MQCMPSARVKFTVPGGPAALSTEYPDDEFRILANHHTDDGLGVVLEARTADTAALVRDLDEALWLPSYDVLHADEQTLLIQYVLPFIPPPVRAVLSSGNLLRFPLTLRNGWIISEMSTSHERLSQLKAEFEDVGLTFEVVSVTQSLDRTDLLTDLSPQL